MPQDDDVAVLRAQTLEGLLKPPPPLSRRVISLLQRLIDLLAGDGTLPEKVIDRDVAGDPQKPRRERDLARLILVYHAHQLEEHLLSNVLRLVLITDHAEDVAVDVVLVADIQEADGLLVA